MPGPPPIKMLSSIGMWVTSLKTKAADKRDGTEPRNAGCPPELMEIWNRRNALKDSSVLIAQGGSGGHGGGNSITAELPPIIHMNGSYPNYVEELDACLGKIQAAASRLEWLSGGLNSDDLVRKEMLTLAQTLKTNLERTNRVKNVILQNLTKATVEKSVEQPSGRHGAERG